MLKQSWCWLMIGLGWLALAVGLVGIVVPLLPTTPYRIVGRLLRLQGLHSTASLAAGASTLWVLCSGWGRCAGYPADRQICEHTTDGAGGGPCRPYSRPVVGVVREYGSYGGVGSLVQLVAAVAAQLSHG